MRLLLLLPIYLYRRILPSALKKRQCLFSEACSHYVWRITRDEGFLAGCRALRWRYGSCRPGYRIQQDVDGRLHIRLVTGEALPASEASEALMRYYS